MQIPTGRDERGDCQSGLFIGCSPQAAQAQHAVCGDLRPPVWIGSARAPFSPLWLLLPCSRKRPASVLMAPTCRHNKFPTATAFANSLGASRRTNNQLGQIVHSCIITNASSTMVTAVGVRHPTCRAFKRKKLGQSTEP